MEENAKDRRANDIPSRTNIVGSISLSDEAVREYKQLYENDFGEQITMAEAREIAHRLVMLYAALIYARPEGPFTPPSPDSPAPPPASSPS